MLKQLTSLYLCSKCFNIIQFKCLFLNTLSLSLFLTISPSDLQWSLDVRQYGVCMHSSCLWPVRGTSKSVKMTLPWDSSPLSNKANRWPTRLKEFFMTLVGRVTLHKLQIQRRYCTRINTSCLHKKNMHFLTYSKLHPVHQKLFGQWKEDMYILCTVRWACSIRPGKKEQNKNNASCWTDLDLPEVFLCPCWACIFCCLWANLGGTSRAE